MPEVQDAVLEQAKTEARFWAKVRKTETCWLWNGAISDGYGRFHVKYKDGRPITARAHRFAYELLVHPVSARKELDHICRNRRCVNPSHLREVTSRENSLAGNTIQAHNLAKTHCQQGHPFDLFNTFYRANGSRRCRVCRLQYNRRWDIEHR